MSPTGAAPRDILVGVDGGGTKTLVRIEDRDGRQLGHGQGGPANVQHSVEGSWRSILDAVGKALAQAGLSLDDRRHRLFCGAGLAGTEVVSAHDRFLATPHPFARLIVKSDGYISCLGAHDGRDGMVIAIGTGTIAFQIEDGREERAGGWGFPHGDEGGGAWLGLEAVRLTFHALDGRAESSPLTDAVFDRFDRDLNRLVSFATRTYEGAQQSGCLAWSLRDQPREQPDAQHDADASHGSGLREHDHHRRGAERKLLAGGRAGPERATAMSPEAGPFRRSAARASGPLAAARREGWQAGQPGGGGLRGWA
jgi:N-acetylglucosamine kinase-like BadF-type ATPase